MNFWGIILGHRNVSENFRRVKRDGDDRILLQLDGKGHDNTPIGGLNGMSSSSSSGRDRVRTLIL